MTEPASTDVKLTDKGRAMVRLGRTLFLPVRMALVLWLLTWPVGGPAVLWARAEFQVFIIMFCVMIALERTGITADPSARSRDRWSKGALVAGLFLPLVLGTWLVVATPTALPAWMTERLPRDVRDPFTMLWGAGILLRRWAMATLGRFFTDRVRIFDDHRVITDGPYRYVRHPSYAGLVLVMVGAPVCLGSTVAVILSVVLGGAALAFRIRVEEAELHASLGDAYAAYAARVPRLIPRPGRTAG